MTAADRSKEHIKVTDLSLAAYLVHEGNRPDLIRDGESPGGHPLAAWCFQDSDKITEAVAVFSKGEARVEPKRFHQSLTQTRRGLYHFLGI